MTGWTEVVIGTVAWVGAMTAYAAWKHRALAKSLQVELASDA